MTKVKKDSKMKNSLKAVAGLGMGAILVGAGVATGFVLDEPKTQTEVQKVNVTNPVNTELMEENEALRTQVANLQNQTPEVVEKEVPVDNEELEYLRDALTERELVADEEFDPVKVLQAEDASLATAVAHIEDEFADYLEDNGLVADEDDVSIVRTYDDLDDVEVLQSDYEDQEYEYKVRVKVDDESADEKKYFLFTVSVEDGEPEFVNVVEE